MNRLLTELSSRNNRKFFQFHADILRETFVQIITDPDNVDKEFNLLETQYQNRNP